MFSAYFAGSYFPTGWGGASEPAAPGTITATILGVGSASAGLRAVGALGLAAAGAGSLSGTMEATEGGTGEMAALVLGLGSAVATLSVTDANPPVAGGGGGIQPTARTRRHFADLALAATGVGRLTATPTAPRIATVGAACVGQGTMGARLAVTERQAVLGFERAAFEAAKDYRPAPVAPLAVFVPTTPVSMAAVLGGTGSMRASATTTRRVPTRPAPPDHRALAVALLMLMEDAA